MRKRAIVTILILAYAEMPAFACGVCSLAIADWILPPAHLWFSLPLTWFLSTVFVGWVSRGELPTPSFFGGVVWAIAAFLVGSAVLGPFATLPLGIWAAIIFVRLARRPKPRGRWVSVAILFGVLHIGIAVAGAAYGIQQRQTRTVADFICRWPSTAPGRAQLSSLSSLGSQAAPAYREIIACSHYDDLALEAAEGLSAVGNAGDISVLESLRPKFRANPEHARRLEAAIQALRAKRA